jgi:hypothetical protein
MKSSKECNAASSAELVEVKIGPNTFLFPITHFHVHLQTNIFTWSRQDSNLRFSNGYGYSGSLDGFTSGHSEICGMPWRLFQLTYDGHYFASFLSLFGFGVRTIFLTAQR